MASLIGTNIARNYEKAQATSQLGTRQQTYFVIDMNTDVTTNYTDPSSLYAKAIKAIQTKVELYSVSIPSGQNFTITCATDTLATDNPGDIDTNQGRNGILEAAIDDACGTSCAVWNARLRGSNIEYDC